MNEPLTAEFLQEILSHMAQCRKLGLRITNIDKHRVSMEMPYSDELVGNPITGVLHGGAITTLLDTNCGVSLAVHKGSLQIAPTLDLRIDYMTAAKPGQPVYSYAEVYRSTRHIVFCRGIAFQEDEQKPIAHCVATFMRLDQETLTNNSGLELPAG